LVKDYLTEQQVSPTAGGFPTTGGSAGTVKINVLSLLGRSVRSGLISADNNSTYIMMRFNGKTPMFKVQPNETIIIERRDDFEIDQIQLDCTDATATYRLFLI
jgi:hypothetical protein